MATIERPSAHHVTEESLLRTGWRRAEWDSHHTDNPHPGERGYATRASGYNIVGSTEEGAWLFWPASTERWKEAADCGPCYCRMSHFRFID